jgi:hypothetical protein
VRHLVFPGSSQAFYRTLTIRAILAVAPDLAEGMGSLLRKASLMGNQEVGSGKAEDGLQLLGTLQLLGITSHLPYFAKFNWQGVEAELY